MTIATSGTAMFHEIANLSENLAAAGGLVLAIVTNFIMLRYIIFPRSNTPIAKQYITYIGTAITFRGIEYLLFLFFHMVLDQFYLLSFISALVISFFGKFFVYDRWVFIRR